MEKVEFRTSADGTVYYKEVGKAEKRLTRYSKEVIEPLLNIVAERWPATMITLSELYAKHYGTTDVRLAKKFIMASRFIRCNMGEDDHLTFDFDGDMLNFEMVHCPLRGGYCLFEGVICKPKPGVRLGEREVEVARYYAEGMTYDEIADAIHISGNTVRVILRNIKNKLGLVNCRDIIRETRKLKL